MSTMDVSVILRLIDGVSGPGKKAAAALRSVVKAANDLKKITGSNKLTRDLKASQGVIRGMSSDVRQFSSAFRGAMDSARGLTKAMSGNGKGMLTADVRNMREMVKLQGQMARSQPRPNARSNIGVSPGGKHGMGLYGAYYAAHEVKQLMAPGAREGMQVLHQQALFTTLGMDAKEQAEAFSASVQASHDVVTSTVSDNQQMVRELRQAFLHPHDAITHLGSFVKANAIFKAISASHAGMGSFKEQSYDFAKAIEQMNITDPHKFEEYLGDMVRAVGAFGGKLTGRDFHQSIKQMRQGGQNLSKEFVGQVLPTLIQEYKVGNSSGGGGGSGGSVGTALMSLFEVVSMGKMTEPAMARWDELGLVDHSKVDYNKKGKIKHINPGGIKGSDLFMQNPYAFAWDKLVPAMLKKGILTTANIEKIEKGEVNNEKFARDVTQYIAGLGGTRTARDVLTRMILQRARIERDRINILQTLGFESWDALKSLDPTVMTDALKAQSGSLMGALWKPFIKGMMPAMASVGKWLADRSKTLWDNPGMAKAVDFGVAGIGAVLLKMALSRFGLGGLAAGALGIGVGAGTGNMTNGILGGLMLGNMFSGSKAASAAAGATVGRGMVAAFLGGVVRAFSLAGIALLIAKMIDEAFGKEIDKKVLGPKKLTGDIVGDAYKVLKGLKPIIEPLVSPFNLGHQGAVPFTKGINVWGESATSGGLHNFGGPASQDTPNGLNPANPSILSIGGASAAAQAWADTALSVAGAKLSGATVPGPSISGGGMVPAPQHYIAPHTGGVGHASLGGNTVHIAAVHVHVNGNGDSKEVGDRVHRDFASAVQRHLSDGAFT